MPHGFPLAIHQRRNIGEPLTYGTPRNAWVKDPPYMRSCLPYGSDCWPIVYVASLTALH